MSATLLAILGVAIEVLLRVLMPSLSKPSTAEDGRRQDALRDRLRTRVRQSWETP